MAKPANNSTVFLEDWLKSIAGYDNNGSSVSDTLNPPKTPLASSPARAIIQAWSDLRDSVKNQSFDSHYLRSLNSLVTLQASLHVADPQAKLVLSILSSQNLSLPLESHPLLFRLLYVWLRKSARPSPSLVGLALEAVSRLVASSRFDARLFSEAVLLLGSVAFASSASETTRLSLDLMSRVLERNYRLMGSFDGIVPNVLAGIGYALSSFSPGDSNYVRVLDFLLEVWRREGGPGGSVSHGLAILHLIEWVATRLIATSSVETVAFFSREAFEAAERKGFAPFTAIMAVAGALRALNKSAQRSELFSKLRVSAEERLESAARSLIRDRSDGLSLQCFALGMARSGPVSSRPDFLVALASALLTEIFPLRRLYLQSIETLATEMDAREHVESVLFKEAGAVASVFCNQYASAKDEESRAAVESLVWNYCRFVYTEHRRVSLAIRGGKEEESLLDIEKVAESAFLMVVVFALTVTKQKLNSNSSKEIRARISREVLVAFSALEYFRRIRLPEYLDTIREVVMCIQESDSACASFVESIPSYADLVIGPDFGFEPKTKYIWFKDEVQTARILFYLRVIATCVDHLRGPLIEKVVAPVMFLYLGHPNEKISRASHSMFAAFVSSEKDSDQEKNASLKEQLVFYYMERSLMGFPGITPIDGLASGVYALVRYLPAGSPGIFYCVHCLVEKANSLCREDSAQKADTWKNWQGDSEPFKKLLDLLLRLTSQVDVQVLPELMKSMAQLIVKLPKDGQIMVLNVLYSMVAESDDVTRKPTLVSWLQSLSYLCFHKDSDARKKTISSNQNKDRETNSVFNARL